MKRITAIIIFLSLLLTAYAQGPAIQWQKSIGGTGGDFGRTLCTSLNGKNHYVGGYSNTANGDIDTIRGGMDIVLCRLDNAGNIIWVKTYGGTGQDFCYSVLPTSDGGLLAGGFSNSADGDVGLNKGLYDLWVFKVDSLGTLQWSRVYGSSANDGDHFVGLTRTSDGGYAVTTNAGAGDGDVSGHHGAYDAWFLKLDATGQIQWKKCAGGTANEDTHVVIEDAAGNYYIAGHTSSNDGDVSGLYGNEDAWVVKLSASGSIIWSRCYGGTDDEHIKSGYLLNNRLHFTGSTNSTDGQVAGQHGGYDMWAIAIDTSGSLIWQRPLGGTQGDYGISVTADFDNMPLICGLTTSSDGDVTQNYGSSDIWMVKLDSAGSLVWQKSFGGTQVDDAEWVVYAPVEGSLIAGFTYSADNDITFNHGFADIWVARLGCAKPEALIQPSDTTFCAGGTVNMQNLTSHAGSYEWSLNGSYYSTASDTSFTFASAGNHQVMLVASYGNCTDTAIATVTVVAPAQASFIPGDTSICQGESLQFIFNGSNANVFSWAMDGNYQAGSSAAQYSFLQAGQNTVSLAAANSYCSDTISHLISVIAQPGVSLGNDTLLCMGCSISFDAGNPGASYLWSTGDTTQTVTVSGTQSLWVIVSQNGCSAVDTVQITEDVISHTRSLIPDNFLIHPNPFHSCFTVEILNTGNYRATLYSSDGKVLENKLLKASLQSMGSGISTPGIFILLIRDINSGNVVFSGLLEKY